MIKTVIDIYKNTFNFRGRSPRRDAWILLGFVFLIMAALGGMLKFLGVNIEKDIKSEYVAILFILLYIVPNISLVVRRLHDCGYSAQKVFGSFFVLGIICVVLDEIKNMFAAKTVMHFICNTIGMASGIIIYLFPIGIKFLLFFFNDDNDNKYGPCPNKAKDSDQKSIDVEELKKLQADHVKTKNEREQKNWQNTIFMYKQSDDFQYLLYFEAWMRNETEIIVCQGKVGEKGKTEEISGNDESETDRKCNEIVQTYKNQGYEEGYFHTLMIEYRITDECGTKEEIIKRFELQDFMNEFLFESGLGMCDGGSTGAGTMEICCLVVDYDLAKQLISDKLKSTKFADYCKIYREEVNEYDKSQ
jgi:uncharacterized membrane protein YhaH (DUF805 family)